MNTALGLPAARYTTPAVRVAAGAFSPLSAGAARVLVARQEFRGDFLRPGSEPLHLPSAEPHGPEQSAGRGQSHAPALFSSGMVPDRRRLRGAVDLGPVGPVVSIVPLPPAMRRGAFLAAMLALPAHAQTACGFGYPTGLQTSVEIAPASDPDLWAVVTIRNRLAGTASGECVLFHDGEEVRVTYAPGPRDVPDRFEIVAPPGYVADPPALILPDGQDVDVPIRPRAMEPMG